MRPSDDLHSSLRGSGLHGGDHLLKQCQLEAFFQDEAGGQV
jgi:hypothetical protein